MDLQQKYSRLLSYAQSAGVKNLSVKQEIMSYISVVRPLLLLKTISGSFIMRSILKCVVAT